MAIHIRRAQGHTDLSTGEEESITSNYSVIHRDLFVFPPRNETTGNLFDYSHPSTSTTSSTSSRDGEEKIFILNHLNDGVNTSYGSRNHVFGKSYNDDEQITNSPDPMLCIVIILLMGIFFHLTFSLMLNGRLDRKSCLPSFLCRGSPDDDEDANDDNNNNSIQPTQADEESAVATSNDRDGDQLQKMQQERVTYVEEALITTTFASIMQRSTSKIVDNDSQVSLEGFVTTEITEASLSSSSSGSPDSFVPESRKESLLIDKTDDTANIKENPIKRSKDTRNAQEETFLFGPTNAAMIIDDSTDTTTTRTASIVTNNTSNERIDANISSTSCAICLEPYQPNDRLSYSKYRRCTHVFHTDCIVSWLVDQKRDDCPYCRGRYILQFGDHGGDDCRNVVRHNIVGGNDVVNGFSSSREGIRFSQNTTGDEEAVNVEVSHVDVG